MAVETSPGRKRAQHPAASNSHRAPASAPGQSGNLLPGERVVSELDSGGEGYFQLTHARVIFNRGSKTRRVDETGDGTVYASVRLKDISSVRISRRPRARRSAAWGVVGLLSAIGVWQVTPDSTIGIAAAVAVALVSLVLIADYWIRPAGVHLEFHTPGGAISGEVGGRASHAIEFAREVENERRRLGPGRAGTPFRIYPSG